MPLSLDQAIALEKKANELRHLIVDTTVWAGSGHLGGSLSMIDAAVLLYYHFMKIDRTNTDWPERDRFILSKGHAGIGYAALLSDLGFLPKEDLKQFNLTGSYLGIHLDGNKVPGVDASTGSLGHGLSIALGMALAGRQKGQSYHTYCILGDGECNEGSVWEAAMAISQFQANRLLTLVDRNFAMIDGPTEDVMGLEPFADKWRAFGLYTEEVDGHDFFAMAEAIERAHDREQPSCLILNTIKGAGVDFASGDYRWHYGAIDESLANEAHHSLDVYHQQRLSAMKGA